MELWQDLTGVFFFNFFETFRVPKPRQHRQSEETSFALFALALLWQQGL